MYKALQNVGFFCKKNSSKLKLRTVLFFYCNFAASAAKSWLKSLL